MFSIDESINKTKALDPKHGSRARTGELVSDLEGNVSGHGPGLLIANLVSRVGNEESILAIGQTNNVTVIDSSITIARLLKSSLLTLAI